MRYWKPIEKGFKYTKIFGQSLFLALELFLEYDFGSQTPKSDISLALKLPKPSNFGPRLVSKMVWTIYTFVKNNNKMVTYL